MTPSPNIEYRVLEKIRVIFRATVVVNWFAVLAIWFLKGIPRPIAMAAFTIFKVTAICASLWLVIEIAEAIAKRTRAVNPVLDAILILPMFGFWFLAWATSF